MKYRFEQLAKRYVTVEAPNLVRAMDLAVDRRPGDKGVEEPHYVEVVRDD